jgi:hypothetical protein
VGCSSLPPCYQRTRRCPTLWVGFFAVTAGYGFASPNGATLAMSDRQSRAGSAAALFGLAQYGMGAVVVALGGLAGVYLSTAASLIPGQVAAAEFGGMPNSTTPDRHVRLLPLFVSEVDAAVELGAAGRVVGPSRACRAG